MGTVADKLTYLAETKTAIRTETNRLLAAQGGTAITTEDTFRSYASKLGTVATSTAPTPELHTGAQPFVVYLSPLGTADSQSSVEVSIPVGVEPGDALVIFGLRRGGLSSMPGWVEAPAPTQNAYAQWAYAYTKTATSEDAGTKITVAYETGSNRLEAGLLVVRHPVQLGEVGIRHVASPRESEGTVDTLTVPEGLSPNRLIAVFYNRVYVLTGNVTTWAVNANGTRGVFTRHQIASSPSGEAVDTRTNAFLTQAAPSDPTLELDDGVGNSSESISSVWLEFFLQP